MRQQRAALETDSGRSALAAGTGLYAPLLAFICDALYRHLIHQVLAPEVLPPERRR
jgi:hypothetical protein